MWTVSTEISTSAQCWARIGQQVIRTEVGTARLDTADIRAYCRYSNTSGQRQLGACCVQWLDQALECLSNPCTLVVVVSLVALFLTDPQDNPDDMLSKGQSKSPMKMPTRSPLDQTSTLSLFLSHISFLTLIIHTVPDKQFLFLLLMVEVNCFFTFCLIVESPLIPYLHILSLDEKIIY